jgi:predicted 2-oxoglutarate/Fe(II)-dependent dioxygenase YbiX
VIEHSFSQQQLKLPQDVFSRRYSTANVCQVKPTWHAHLAGFILLESRGRETARRMLGIDAAIVKLRELSAGSKDAVRFTACPRNLLRMWAAT